MVDIVKAEIFAVVDLDEFLVAFVPLHNGNIILLDVKDSGDECDNSIVRLAVPCWVTDAQANCVVINGQDLV